LLNLFLKNQEEKANPAASQRRPHLASECTDVDECERWRRQVIREISRDVAAIQNAGLGEFRIRDLNDAINKRLREKTHWEAQIRALGGPDHAAAGAAARVVDQDGRRALGTEGYLYFGAAKDLPGVRELFERREAEAPRRKRGELAKVADAEYYGFRDEDDERLLRLEARAEAQALERARAEELQARDAEERARAGALNMADSDSDGDGDGNSDDGNAAKTDAKESAA